MSQVVGEDVPGNGKGQRRDPDDVSGRGMRFSDRAKSRWRIAGSG